jgi:hypothetical protein
VVVGVVVVGVVENSGVKEVAKTENPDATGTKNDN